MKEEVETTQGVELTDEEREFLTKILSQINIQASQPNAEQVVFLVKNILFKVGYHK